LWTLTGWLKGTHRSMPFAVPMVWRKPRNHLDDCCLCITNISGFSVQSKHTIKYPNIPSALTLVPDDDSMPVSDPPKDYSLELKPEPQRGSTRSCASTRTDQDFPVYSTVEPHWWLKFGLRT
jgi:hypothetical protein